MYNLSINWTHCHTQRTVAAASEVSVLALSVWLHVPLSTSSRYANEAQAVQKADYVGGHGTQLMAICFAAAVSLDTSCRTWTARVAWHHIAAPFSCHSPVVSCTNAEPKGAHNGMRDTSSTYIIRAEQEDRLLYAALAELRYNEQ